MSKKKKSVQRITIPAEKVARCINWLNVGLAVGLVYALALVFSISLNIAVPDLNIPEFIHLIILLIWALSKIGLAFALICLYQSTGYFKWAIAALLLAASAVMPYALANPEAQIFVIGIEALAITALSLSLFDLGKATRREMGIPAGMMFLGVILQILQNALMAYVGIVFLAIGFYLSLKNLSRRSQ